MNTEQTADTNNLELAFKRLQTALQNAFDKKQRFTFMHDDYIFCNEGDVITFKEDFSEDDVQTTAKALMNGVYIFAKTYDFGDIHEPTGERPIHMMHSDDFIAYMKNQLGTLRYTAETIHQQAALITLQVFDINEPQQKAAVGM